MSDFFCGQRVEEDRDCIIVHRGDDPQTNRLIPKDLIVEVRGGPSIQWSNKDVSVLFDDGEHRARIWGRRARASSHCTTENQVLPSFFSSSSTR